ncbi:MAG: hypothetical protein OEM79_03685 [Nitrosopumilus sp.]|nr:hypothetical protein [Nitrosopumilus sp.]
MKYPNPAEGPVNVKKYTLYAMIPGLDTYAFSKLDKKKQALKITIIGIIGIIGATGIVMFQMANDAEIQSELNKDLKAELVYQKFMPQMLLVIFGSLAIYLPIVAYLVRKWSKEWNKQFEF